jgi:hypothetical protein
MNKSKTLPLSQVLPLLAIYLVISIVGMVHHELWLDEAQHFLIGRDSHSLPSLYYNMRYDGHPRLWNILIYFITHYITESYIGMQVFHLLITSCTVFIFLRYAPFSLLVKVLILSGYYFLFEYNLLSRNYALGILLLFTCCILLRDPRKTLVWIGVTLFVMCNTHLFYAIAAIGIFLYLALEYAQKKELFTPRFALFTVLFLAGMACIFIQTQTPREDNFYHIKPADWVTGKNLSFAGFGLIRGWLPIPQFFSGHFWNSFWLEAKHIGYIGEGILFLFFIAFPAVILKKFTRALVFYYSSLFILLAFFVVTQMTGSRYFGMAYIYFLAACWMTGYDSGEVFSLQQLPGTPNFRLFLQSSFYLILSAQIVIGLFALEQDFARPFSQSKNTIGYIQDQHLAGQQIAVDGYNAGPVLSAYLGRQVYYLDIGQLGSWIYWKKSYWPTPRRTIEQEMSGSAYLQGLDKFILISNRRLDIRNMRSGNRSFQLAPLDSFVNSIVIGENYYVSQVTRTVNDSALAVNK